MACSVIFVDVLRIDPEADPGLAGEVSRVLSVALGLSHRLGECLLAFVDDRSATTNRNVVQIVAFVVDDQSDPRIAADVRYPAAIPVSVESDVVLTNHVVDDDLAGRAVGPDRRQDGTPRRRQELAHRLDKTLAVAHHTK
jgi:hypothetical protein